MNKIEKLRDVKFMEDNQSLATYLADKGLFYYFDFILKEENKLLSMKVNNPFDSDNKSSPIYSDTETPLCRSTKTRHIPDKYNTIAQHLAMSIFVQDVIYEPLTYNEALRFSESAK